MPCARSRGRRAVAIRQLRTACDRPFADSGALGPSAPARERAVLYAMASGGGAELVIASAAMRRIAGEVERAAALSSTVLLLGETGVGKGLVARTLHACSPRRD